MHVRLSEWGMALGAAIAVHTLGFALWYWAPSSPTDAGAGGISISLAPTISINDDQAQTEVFETQEPLPIDEESIEEESVVERQIVTPVPEPEIETQSKPVERARVPREAQPTTSSAPAAASAASNQVSTGSAAAEVGVGDANAKANYVALIADRLARFKRYPRAARRRGLQGVAKLAFTLRRDGSLVTYEIVQSAGYQVLDREVQNTLERAVPMPPFPPELSLQTLDVIVPIRFELTNN